MPLEKLYNLKTQNSKQNKRQTRTRLSLKDTFFNGLSKIT